MGGTGMEVGNTRAKWNDTGDEQDLPVPIVYLVEFSSLKGSQIALLLLSPVTVDKPSDHLLPLLQDYLRMFKDMFKKMLKNSTYCKRQKL